MLQGLYLGVSTIQGHAESVGITQGKWAGSSGFFFTVVGDQIIDISWTQFVAPWNNKPCKVCMTACKIKNGKVDCKEGNWQHEGKPDRPAYTLVGSFEGSASFTGIAKSAGCSFSPCGQSGAEMSGLDYTATDVKARPVSSKLINGLIIIYTLSFRHAVSRNPVNSTRSGCRIKSGMTVLFWDD